MSLLLAPTSAPATQWAERSAQRLDWALRAYRRFIDQLGADTRARLAQGGPSGEAYVVVFGKTQVGKTTLLLDLMGVRPEAQHRVGLVLRGGRGKGQSATSTAMAYRRSDSGSWHLKADGQPVCSFADDTSMTQALAQIRQQMESRALTDEDPCVVSIPADCFDTDTATAPRVRMLDLPGDNPSNKVERDHVQQMAKRYVPHADLILLIGRGDDLSFLRPKALELPSIEDWQIVPSRFRVVTTYSFTAESILKLARKHKNDLDTQLFRQRLVEQIETFGLSLSDDARQLDRFFPLEFGDSWTNPAKNHRDVVEALSPMVDSLKKQLREDITKSATEYERLRSAVYVHVVVRRLKEGRLAEMQVEFAFMEKSLKAVQQDIESTKNGCSQAKEELKGAKARAAKVTPVALKEQIEVSSTLNIAEYLQAVDGIAKSVSAFQLLIAKFSSNAMQQFLQKRPQPSEAVPAWFWRVTPVSLNNQSADVKSQIDSEFSGLNAKLAGYWLDDYWQTGPDSDYRKDKASMRYAMTVSADALRKILVSCWSKAAKKVQTNLNKALHEANMNYANWQQSLKAVASAEKSAQIKLIREQAKRDDFVSKMEAEEVASRQFLTLLDEAYLTELRDRRKKMFHQGSAVATFLEVLAAVQIGVERQKLLQGLE